MIIEANNLSTQRTKIIRWHKCQKTPNSIPIEATQDENSIEVRFLEDIDDQVTFQRVKDNVNRSHVIRQLRTLRNNFIVY